MSVIIDCESLAHHIRERRLALGLSQAQVASQVGASRQWIIDMEKGKPRAELGMALMLLSVLGLQLQLKNTHIKKRSAIDVQAGEEQIKELAAAFDFLD